MNQENTQQLSEQPSTPQPSHTSDLKSGSFTKIILFTFGIVFILGLIGVSYYLGTKKSPATSKEKITISSPTQVVIASPTTIVSPSIHPSDSQSLQVVLQSLQQSISTNAPITARKSIDWFDDNNQVVPLKGWDFGIGIASNNYMGQYGSFSNINDITESSLQPLKSAVDSYFVKNSFTTNKLNNRKNPLNIYYGYTLNDIKCLVTLSPQTDPFGRFFCGRIDNEELAWRKELVPVINPKNDSTLQVSIDKLVGNYATGGVGGYGGGAIWYAVQINGQWKEVWTGQNIISCKPVQQYNIPKEIYGNDCSNNY